MLNAFSGMFNIPDLRKKFLFTLAMLAVFRLGAHIPVAGIDTTALQQLFSRGGLLGFLDLFTGGAMVKFSVFALGILPYINASIIIQLLTVVIPQLEQLSKEGGEGRKKIAQYTRYFAVFLAVFQATATAFAFRGYLKPDVSFGVFLLSSIIALTAGTCIIMWIGELITERGIGNGASLLIFVGIVSRIPFYIGNTLTLLKGGGSLIGVLILLATFLATIVLIVIVSEAQRRIQVQYAKRIVGRKVYGGQSTYIPLRINQGGVLPIIFAVSVLYFPATIAQFVHAGFLQAVSAALVPGRLWYMVAFFFLIFFFTYFYTAITFNPVDLADNIKKYGGFVMGIRPGKPTAEFLEYTITRLTLVGAIFLAVVAIIPAAVEGLTHVTTFQGLGATSFLIIVGVALDLIRQIETHLVARQYEGLVT